MPAGNMLLKHIRAGIYLFKVNNRNTRTRCEICSKLTIKTIERHQWRRLGAFIVNFKHISYLVLVFLLLTLNMYLPAEARALFLPLKKISYQDLRKMEHWCCNRLQCQHRTKPIKCFNFTELRIIPLQYQSRIQNPVKHLIWSVLQK